MGSTGSLFSKVPSLVLVSRMAWGNLQKPEQHVGLDYKTLNEGYFESGIELNQFLKDWVRILPLWSQSIT
jgi:hypothetical protein